MRYLSRRLKKLEACVSHGSEPLHIEIQFVSPQTKEIVNTLVIDSDGNIGLYRLVRLKTVRTAGRGALHRWHLMAGHGAKFGRKQEEAIAALLSQRNVEDAARTAGVGTRTLLRWMKLPEFQAAYREARRAAFSQSIARLQQASSAAATTLLKVMLDPNSPASTRVRAAESILVHAAKAIEIEDIEVRFGQDLLEHF